VTRAFLAVRPSDPVRDALHRLPRLVEPGVRWVPPAQWHITLRFWPDADPAELMARLAGIELPAATAVLGPVVSRLGRSTVVVPVSGLDQLADAVRASTADLPPPPDQRGFTGHLTLARVRDRAACGVAGARFSAIFAVHEIELVTSVLSQSGAQHQTVARWPVAS
jgi:2'-5' RNA ligase